MWPPSRRKRHPGRTSKHSATPNPSPKNEKENSGVSKGCCLEVFKYLRVSKKHSFVTPGLVFLLFPHPAGLLSPRL